LVSLVLALLAEVEAEEAEEAALVADVPADVAEFAALVADVLAALADEEADVAELAAAVAAACASELSPVIWLMVMSFVASPAPPSPRYIAI